MVFGSLNTFDYINKHYAINSISYIKTTSVTNGKLNNNITCDACGNVYSYGNINSFSEFSNLEISTDNGSSWNQLNGGTSLRINKLCCSASGQYLYYIFANLLYKSIDKGATFNNIYTGNNISALCCSISGKNVYICDLSSSQIDYNVYYSYNFGATFTAISNSYHFIDMVCDYTGKYVYATDGKIFYASDTSGQSFVSTPITTSYSIIISCNSTGKYVYLIAKLLDGKNTVFCNTNYGIGEFKKSIRPESILGICCDSTGKYVYVPSITGNFITFYFLYSLDYGSTWNVYYKINIDSGYTYNSITCDSTGKYVYVSEVNIIGNLNQKLLSFIRA